MGLQLEVLRFFHDQINHGSSGAFFFLLEFADKLKLGQVGAETACTNLCTYFKFYTCASMLVADALAIQALLEFQNDPA